MQIKLSDLTTTATVIYEIHALPPGGARYQAWVGRCPLADFPLLADARRSEAMRNLLKNEQFMSCAHITVLAIETDERTIFEKHMNLYRPMLNPDIEFVGQVERPAPGRKTEKVECMETGEIFENARQACNTLGLDPGTMSRHLKTGKGTIGGCTFKRWVK